MIAAIRARAEAAPQDIALADDSRTRTWSEVAADLERAAGALLAAAPVYATANLILGFAFSALAESQMQAMQGAVFFYLPSMLLSGFMFPFQGMPSWARAIGEVLPLTHFVRAARGVLLKGQGAAVVAQEMWPVALFGLVAAALALTAYRRRLD